MSNLSLVEAHADKLCKGSVLDLIFDTATKHEHNVDVVTSILGLVANLAIREDVALRLAERGAVTTVIRGLVVHSSADNTRGLVAHSNADNATASILAENAMAAL